MTQTSAPSSPSPLREQTPECDPADGSAVTEQAEETEFSRLESLLFARTRSHGNLQREFERRNRLLREGLDRISLAVSDELGALRTGYDAAVARAIEAEVGRAELMFALDETRAQLTAAPSPQPGSASLYGGVAERTAGIATFVPNPATGEPAAAAQRIQDLERELSTAGQRAEQERAAARAKTAEQTGQLEALRGELRGLRARLLESEQALHASQAQVHGLGLRLAAAQQRIEEVRSEVAEIGLLAQSRAARLAELTQAAAVDLQEIRTLRAQVSAAAAAQAAQSDARDADRQHWAERLQQIEAREQEAWNGATAAMARSETQLRAFLVSLEQPLRRLDASWAAAGQNPREPLLHSALRPDDTSAVSPGSAVGQGADARDQGELIHPAGSAECPGPQSEAPHVPGELARERQHRQQLIAAVKALQAATQSGEPTHPWIEELVALVGEGDVAQHRG